MTLLLVFVLLSSSASARQRVGLLTFEGDSAAAIRWRVAQILKRAGHTVLGYKPPRDPDSAEELRRYAKRWRVDAFVSGSAVESSSGWELALTVRGPGGESWSAPLDFTASSLRELVKELKREGQGRLDRVVEGGADSAPGAVELDARGDDAAGAGGDVWDVDAAEPARKKSKRKRSKKKSRRATLTRRAKDERAQKEEAVEPVPIELDDDAPADDDASADDAGSVGEEPRALSSSIDAEAGGERSADAEDGGDELRGDDTPEDEAPDESSGGEVHGRYATAIIGVDAGLVRRDLTYVDDIYGRQRTPRTNAWVYRIHGALYPFARPLKDRVGLIAGYESSFSGAVRDNDAGAEFAVSFSELYGGLRLRQPIGRHEIGVQGSVGTLSAGLDDSDGASGVPEFSYTVLTPSVDVGLDFGALGVRTAIGYKKTLGDFGEVSSVDFFPRMEGDGIDGKLQLEYRYSEKVAFQLAGTVRRFVLQMNSIPQDAIDGRSEVAGGAIDLYLGGYFGLNLKL